MHMHVRERANGVIIGITSLRIRACKSSIRLLLPAVASASVVGGAFGFDEPKKRSMPRQWRDAAARRPLAPLSLSRSFGYSLVCCPGCNELPQVSRCDKFWCDDQSPVLLIRRQSRRDRLQ